MAAKLFVLFACLALSQARMVRRDAPESTLLQDIGKHAEEFKKTFTEQFAQISDSKNTEAVTKALKEGSDSLLQQLSAFSATLQEALGDANGKAKEALEQTRQNIEQKTAELRQQHPEVEQQVSALRDNLSNVVQHVAQQTKNLASEVEKNVAETNQQLAPKIKAAYDDLVKRAEAVQKKVHDAANN